MVACIDCIVRNRCTQNCPWSFQPRLMSPYVEANVIVLLFLRPAWFPKYVYVGVSGLFCKITVEFSLAVRERDIPVYDIQSNPKPRLGSMPPTSTREYNQLRVQCLCRHDAEGGLLCDKNIPRVPCVDTNCKMKAAREICLRTYPLSFQARSENRKPLWNWARLFCYGQDDRLSTQPRIPVSSFQS